MCSPDPRTSDPVCDSCNEPPMSGRLRCGPCQARLHFDCDEPGEVDALVADGFLTRAEADQIGRECVEYVTWAREQNAAAVHSTRTEGPPPVAGYTANGQAYWVCQNDPENS